MGKVLLPGLLLLLNVCLNAQAISRNNKNIAPDSCFFG
jgi:hypothetical protein